MIKLIGISGKSQNGKNLTANIIQYLTAKKPYQVSLEEYVSPDHWLHTSENNNWQVKSFAYKLKQVVSLLTGIPVGDLEKEEVKQSKLPVEWLCWKLSFIADHNDFDRLIWKMFSTEDEARTYMDETYIIGGKLEQYLPTYRELLQILGTDLLRNQLHPDVWVNALFSDYRELYMNNPWYNDNDIFSVSELDELIHKPEYPNWVIPDVRFINECQAIEQRGGIVVRVERLGLESKSTHISETELDNHVFAYTLFNDKDIPYLVSQVKAMLKQFKIPYND